MLYTYNVFALYIITVMKSERGALCRACAAPHAQLPMHAPSTLHGAAAACDTLLTLRVGASAFATDTETFLQIHILLCCQ